MPAYKYECPSCKHTELRFNNVSKRDSPFVCNKCGYSGVHNRMLPDNTSGRAMETRDEYRGKSVVQDTEKMVHERATDHWKKYELPEFIQKNGIEEAIKNGWVDPETKRPK